MEKTVELKMNKDKSMKIYINGEEKHAISGDNRSISADKIYEILGFSVGDSYRITSECETDTDKQVLDFFKELFDEVAEKVNALVIA